MKKPLVWFLSGMWIMGILFPMAWFSEQFSSISVLFNGFFSQQWAHIVMQTSLYAILMVFLCFFWEPNV